MTDGRIKEEMLKALDIDGILYPDEVAFQKEMSEFGVKDECATAYYVGFRTAERLAKLEVLEGVKGSITALIPYVDNDYEEGYEKALEHAIQEIEKRISQIKEQL